ncbi:hypothetical protein D3C77_289170 [compost metagenome]
MDLWQAGQRPPLVEEFVEIKQLGGGLPTFGRQDLHLGDIGPLVGATGVGDQIQQRHLVRPFITARDAHRPHHHHRPSGRHFQPGLLVDIGLFRHKNRVAGFDLGQRLLHAFGVSLQIDRLDRSICAQQTDLATLGIAGRTTGIGQNIEEGIPFPSLISTGFEYLAHDVDGAGTSFYLLFILGHEDSRARRQIGQQLVVAGIEIGFEIEQLGGITIDHPDPLHPGKTGHTTGPHQQIYDGVSTFETEGTGTVDLAKHLDRLAGIAIPPCRQRRRIKIDLHVANEGRCGHKHHIEGLQRRQETGIAGIEITLVVETRNRAATLHLHIVELGTRHQTTSGIKRHLYVAIGCQIIAAGFFDITHHADQQPLFQQGDGQLREVVVNRFESRADEFICLWQGLPSHHDSADFRQCNLPLSADLKRLIKGRLTGLHYG